jgi:hypothetical protein
VSNTRNFTLFNKKTNVILEVAVPFDQVRNQISRFSNRGIEVGVVMFESFHTKHSNILEETVTSASSVAVNMDTAKKPTFVSFLSGYAAIKADSKKRKNSKPNKPFSILVKEAMDINDVISRLSSLENNKSKDKRSTVTFGVEDDSGNIMKITVKADKAEELEREIAVYLSQNTDPLTGAPAKLVSDDQQKGSPKDISMAEILYNLKDKFEIIDVEFPKIPTDVIYNADKATTSKQGPIPSENDEIPQEAEFAGMDDSGLGMDELGPDGGLPPEGDLAQGEEGDLELDSEQNPFADDDSVEEFGDETAPTDEKSLLQQVLDMLDARAKADAERAKADAERAKADQARYTAQAAEATLKQQERLARIELDMEAEDEAEKEAKKIADMARFNVRRGMTSESVIAEADEFATVQSLRREKAMIAQKYAVDPSDDPETRAYKSQQRILASREIDAKIRQAMNRDRYVASRNAQGQPTNPQQRPNPQQQQQQQQGQPGQQQNGGRM